MFAHLVWATIIGRDNLQSTLNSFRLNKLYGLVYTVDRFAARQPNHVKTLINIIYFTVYTLKCECVYVPYAANRVFALI